MNYRLKLPHPDTFLARNADYRADLYAELGAVPLYANVRLIAPGLVGQRSSYRLGWLIDDARWANGRDARLLPAALLAWAGELVRAAYPDLQSVTGMTAEEIEALKAEQAAKRAAREAALSA